MRRLSVLLLILGAAPLPLEVCLEISHAPLQRRRFAVALLEGLLQRAARGLGVRRLGPRTHPGVTA